MKVIIKGQGEKKEKNMWNMPDTYEVTITRNDGLTPTQPEILTVLKLALEALKPKRKGKIKNLL